MISRDVAHVKVKETYEHGANGYKRDRRMRVRVRHIQHRALVGREHVEPRFIHRLWVDCDTMDVSVPGLMSCRDVYSPV